MSIIGTASPQQGTLIVAAYAEKLPYGRFPAGLVCLWIDLEEGLDTFAEQATTRAD